MNSLQLSDVEGRVCCSQNLIALCTVLGIIQVRKPINKAGAFYLFPGYFKHIPSGGCVAMPLWIHVLSWLFWLLEEGLQAWSVHAFINWDFIKPDGTSSTWSTFLWLYISNLLHGSEQWKVYKCWHYLCFKLLPGKPVISVAFSSNSGKCGSPRFWSACLTHSNFCFGLQPNLRLWNNFIGSMLMTRVPYLQ